MPAGERRHPLVIHAVLEVDDHACVRLQEPNAEQRGPISVVAFDGEENGIERLMDALRLIQVERLRVNQVLATRATQSQP